MSRRKRESRLFWGIFFVEMRSRLATHVISGAIVVTAFVVVVLSGKADVHTWSALGDALILIGALLGLHRLARGALHAPVKLELSTEERWARRDPTLVALVLVALAVVWEAAVIGLMDGLISAPAWATSVAMVTVIPFVVVAGVVMLGRGHQLPPID